MKTQKRNLSGKSGRYFINLLGILAALAVAFGGLFLVQSGLAREQERLLEAGGIVELPPPTAEIEIADAEEIMVGRLLTEEELIQITTALSEPVDIRLHEPLQGQLTMVQAVEYAQNWLEDFLIINLGITGLSSGEYRTTCYLWTPEAGQEEQETRPWLSCWSVSLINQEIEAFFLLNAVSGQILDASVGCTAPVEHQSFQDLLALFNAYTSSFGLESANGISGSQVIDNGGIKLPWFQNIGDKGLYTMIQASSVDSVFESSDSGTIVSREIFSIRLSLGLGLEPSEE